MARRRGQPTQPTDRYARVETALRVIRELLSASWSVRDLAGHLGISDRSLYRLLHAIERVLPLHRSTVGRHVRYRILLGDLRSSLGASQEEQKRRRAERIASRLCPACGAPRSGPRTQLCVRCANINRANSRAHWRRIQRRRRAAGLCLRCGARPYEPGRKRCAECAAYSSAHERGRKES